MKKKSLILMILATAILAVAIASAFGIHEIWNFHVDFRHGDYIGGKYHHIYDYYGHRDYIEMTVYFAPIENSTEIPVEFDCKFYDTGDYRCLLVPQTSEKGER